MSRTRVSAGVLALAPLLAAGAVFAHEYQSGPLTIGHPWARATAPSAVNGAAYLTVENAGEAADRLLGAASPIAETVELHESAFDANGVMRMQRLDGIAIPAGGAVALEPGGYHIMMIGLHEPLVEGTRFPLVLTFEMEGEVPVEVVVEAAGARSAPDHDHGEHGHHGHGHGGR